MPADKGMDVLVKNGSENPKDWEYPNRPEGLRYVLMSGDGKTIINDVWDNWPLAKVHGKYNCSHFVNFCSLFIQ